MPSVPCCLFPVLLPFDFLPFDFALSCALIHHHSWLTFAKKSPLTLLEVLYHRWSCLFYISESRLLHKWKILSAWTVFMSTKRKPLLAIVGVISSGRKLSNNDPVIYRLVHISSLDIDKHVSYGNIRYSFLWQKWYFLEITTNWQSLPGSVRVAEKRLEIPGHDSKFCLHSELGLHRDQLRIG